jgi:hypothetical protein
MSGPPGETLYALLPAVYRTRDAEQGQPLRALLALSEEALDAARAEYDDWFIETCDPALIPYIGDLLGVRPLAGVETGAVSERAYVANTIRYRRRKGTASVLEALARDVTGWRTHVVEFFQQLAVTQHVNHVRPDFPGFVPIRDGERLELFNGPFEHAPHTLEVRRIPPARGKYGIPNVGIFVWRLRHYDLTRTTARRLDEGRWTVDPLGRDVPLFNRPRDERRDEELVGELHVPGMLRRRPLYDELEARRHAKSLGQDVPARWLPPGEPTFSVFLDGADQPLDPLEICICHLGDADTPPELAWRRPPGSLALALDPRTGRMTFPAGKDPQDVEVSSVYGFCADLGGGPYDRQASFEGALGENKVDWQIAVGRGTDPVAGEVVATIGEAVDTWLTQPLGTVGVITILDSRTYAESLTGPHALTVPAGSKLVVVAADWPLVPAPNPDAPNRRVRGHVSARGLRPHLQGDIEIVGTSGDPDAAPGELILDGLLIEGGVNVLPGELGRLRLAHTTIAPRFGGLTVAGSGQAGKGNAELIVTLNHTICGPLALAEGVPTLCVADSILDGAGGQAMTAPTAAAEIVRATVLGEAQVRSLQGSNSIFAETMRALQRQTGCVRYSFLAENSQVPRAYRCQPALALAGVSDEHRAQIIIRLQPQFTSTEHGDPGYAQLASGCAAELRTGADDGSEMGAFNSLQQPQREANLTAALDEYLRVGLDAGVFYLT